MIAIVVLAILVAALIFIVGYVEGRRSALASSAARIRREINRARVLRG